MKKPPGALSKDELIALVKPGQDIYKVFKKHNEVIGYITNAHLSGEIIGDRATTLNFRHTIYLNNWFEKKFGFLFDNYFHALAYSLKLKAQHGQKSTTEERTGMAGAP